MLPAKNFTLLILILSSIMLRPANQLVVYDPCFVNADSTTIVEPFVPVKIDSNRKNSDGDTLLYVAMERCDLDRVRFLIKSSADVNKPSNVNGYETLLIVAVIQGNRPAVELLIGAGANINQADSRKGWTPLMWAAVRQKCQVMQLFLDNGVDVDKKDKEDSTVFQMALSRGQSDNCSTSDMRHSLTTMKKLVEHGAAMPNEDVFAMLRERHFAQDSVSLDLNDTRGFRELVISKIKRGQDDCIQGLKEWGHDNDLVLPFVLINLIGEYITDISCCDVSYPFGDSNKEETKYNRSAILGAIGLSLERVGPQFTICKEES